MIENSCFLDALKRRNLSKTPVWIMRQAGRYLPEYRAVRKRAKNFLSLCKTPELACEVSLQPLRRYPLDAAIIFSDILIVPEAMGLPLSFREPGGPVFTRSLEHEKEIRSLRTIEPEEQLDYLLQAIKLSRRELAGRVPLIGFAGSPWTLAGYMIEGRASRTFPRAKAMLRQRPKLLQELLDKLSLSVAACLNAQAEAGAQCLMIFDTWGGLLPAEQYPEFSLAPIKNTIGRLRRKQRNNAVPCIVFGKGNGMHLEKIADSGCDAIGIDWSVDIGQARQRVGHRAAIQGNLNPEVLLESESVIVREVNKVLHAFGRHAGHIFNLGHGVLPNTQPEKAAVMVEAVHAFRHDRGG